MGILDLHNVEPGRQCTFEARHPRALEVLNVGLGHFLRLGVLLVVRDRTGSIHIIRPTIYIFVGDISPAEPRRDGAGFPTRVRQLNADILTLAMSKLDNSLEWRDLRIFPEPGVFRGDSTFGCHSRSLYHVEAWPAHRHSTEMGKKPIRVVAILGGNIGTGVRVPNMSVDRHTGLDSKTYHDAVLHLHSPDFQGLEEFGWK